MNSRLNKDQVTKAVVALLKHMDNVTNSKKSSLLEEDNLVLLGFSFFKIPEKKKVKPTPIPIPHSLFEQDIEICLFTKDPQKFYKEKLVEQGVKVAKVIGLTKLRKNYGTFEAKRKLGSSYDLFLADDRILPSLSKALGSTFFKRKKQPIAIKVSGNLKNEINRALSCTYLFINGACSVVKAAKSSLSRDEVIENIMEATKGVVERVPKKWGNIQSIYIKSNESIALPIYNALPTAVTRILGEEKEEEKEEIIVKNSKGKKITKTIERRKFGRIQKSTTEEEIKGF